MAIDCCEHTLAALRRVRPARLTSVGSKETTQQTNRADLDLIVIGVARFPVRRLFISQLRRVYAGLPMLILRREEDGSGGKDAVRGEFVLSDECRPRDLEMVDALRLILPLAPCSHTRKERGYDTVREVMHIIAEKHSDPKLSLTHVAKALAMSPKSISRILNQQVEVNFRQMLRRTRIEEAKRMLASRRYSVKEVAARVGFTDSHYFSRSFKELTGVSASEYRSQDATFG